jgi:hypothetical protein
LPETKTGSRDALLLLGCPQVPIQTSVALYLAGKLRKQGITTVITGNRAARTNIEVADPDHHYIGEVIDIDRCIAQIAEKKREFHYCFSFIHNDAGISYAATVKAMSPASQILIIFGEHYEEVAASVEFPAEIIAVNAVHNPMPLKAKIDEVLPWVVSNL